MNGFISVKFLNIFFYHYMNMFMITIIVLAATKGNR